MNNWLELNGYRTVTYATSNEDKLREVVLEYEKTWWQWLLMLPVNTESWVGGSVWYNKHTGERAGLDKTVEIEDAIMWNNTQTKYFDRL